MGCRSVCGIGLNGKKMEIDKTEEYAEFLDALLWVNHFNCVCLRCLLTKRQISRREGVYKFQAIPYSISYTLCSCYKIVEFE